MSSNVTIELTAEQTTLLWRCVHAGQAARNAGHIVAGTTRHDDADEQLQSNLKELDDLLMQATFAVTTGTESALAQNAAVSLNPQETSC